MDEEAQHEGLWQDHLAAWTAWCAISGQWRHIVLSGNWGAKVIWEGIDYGAVPAALSLAGLSVTPEIWDQVRTIEEGAVEEMNRRG